MFKPTLWVLVGISGSGKSTIAGQIAKEVPNTVVVSTDAIRKELTGTIKDQSKNKEVFRIFYKRIRENLSNKKNVVADATNLTVKSRDLIRNQTKGLDIYAICVVIYKPFEQCKRDNLCRPNPVPETVLGRQFKMFCMPSTEENWGKIVVYDATKCIASNIGEETVNQKEDFKKWWMEHKNEYPRVSVIENLTEEQQEQSMREFSKMISEMKSMSDR